MNNEDTTLKEQIAERQRTEGALRSALDESRRRQAEITALLESSKAVLKFKEFKDAAQAIFTSCKKLVGASAGYVALLNEEGSENEVLFLDSGGLACAVDPSLPMPIRGFRAGAYRSGKTVVENDFARSKWAKRMPNGHVYLDNALFAPLVIDKKTVGLMGLANKPGGFSANDAKLATAFAETAAIALYNSRLLESLTDREQCFRSVAQSAIDAIMTIDDRGNLVHWNGAAAKIFGFTAKEVTGRPLTLIIPKRLRRAHEQGIERIASRGRARIIGKTIETTGLKKDGREFPMELSLSTWKTKEKTFFSGIIRDITERKSAEDELKSYRDHLERLVEARTSALRADIDKRKEAEAKIAHLNRLYSVLSEVNEAIVRMRDPHELFDAVCRIITDKGRIRTAWIGLFEPEHKQLKLAAAWGGGKNRLRKIPCSKDGAPSGCGPASVAMRTGKHFVCNDFDADPQMRPWRETTVDSGHHSCAAFPLKTGSQVLGALNICAEETSFFDREIVRLFNELADDISFALHSAEDEEQRRRAEDELEKGFVKLQKALNQTIETITHISEMRDPYTAGHEQRVSQLACAMAGDLKMAEARIDGLRVASLLHDIGKMAVPIEILSKPGKMSEREFSLIKEHSRMGHEILKYIEFPWPVAEIVLQSHERLDGSGYPSGLGADQIMPEAKILAVADVVEAMLSHRPYRPALGETQALKEISDKKGVLFDPAVVGACLRLFRRRKFKFAA